MNEYSNPLITVITVCYNSGKTIENTIKSILSQTYPNYEYLIIDGESTDNTLRIIESYRERFNGKLHVISEKDTGIYNAMNKGIKNSSGKMIGIVNSDDYYSPDTLEVVAKMYEEEQYPLLIINGDMVRVSDTGKEIYTYSFTEEQVEKKACFGHPAMFAAKAVYEKIGLYDESYKLASDGDWQYRALEDNQVRYVLSHKIFSHMREGGASDNPKYRWKWFQERVRLKKEHHRGTVAKIYLQEFISVIRTDIKAVTPKKFQRYLYELKYGKG